MKKRTDNFDKFANQKKGSAIKEEYRQQKKKLKQEARAAGEEMRKKKIEKQRGIRDEDTRDKGQATRKTNKDPRDSTRETGNKKYQGKGTAPIRPQGRPAAGNREQTKGPDHKPQTTDHRPETGPMPLNKYISHSGICGRREAADLVKAGYVSVNGDKIFEPGYKVSGKDKVSVKGKQVFLQKNSVYLLLNKPKDFLTTSNDPQGRKTVLDLVKQATTERVYPVGRLDRNTTGVLILTNDGELAQKLTHPSFEVKKIYEVTLDKPVTKKDIEAILSGIVLEDGPVKADAAGYADAHNKHVVGIEIHSGRNRIVRRIFEHLGYDVKGLDRVMFGNLTKKNVERGKWRFLNEKEVRLLKFMNNSFVRKSKTTGNIVTDETD
jgi:23S rRNA pseudouridine2605 synthase